MRRATIVILTLLLLMVVAGCAVSDETEDESNAAGGDDAEIYAVAISEIHSLAPSSGLVFVIGTTEDTAFADAQVAPAAVLPADLQDAITAELVDAPFELIWIESFDDAPKGPINPESEAGWHIAEGNGIVISLGNIHVQEDDSVQLSFFMTCADTCGTGKTFVLTQDFGNWHVSDSVGPEIAS